MQIKRKKFTKSPVKASRYTRRPARAIKAEDEIIDEEVDYEMEEEGGEGAVSVDPEATDLLFEAEDVAELVAEITGQDVEVTADEDAVVFSVGDADYTVEPEGDEEILESSRKALRGKKSVKASVRKTPRKPVAASTRNRRPAARAARPARRK